MKPKSIQETHRRVRDPFEGGTNFPRYALKDQVQRPPLRQQFWQEILKPLLANVGTLAFGLAIFGGLMVGLILLIR